MTSESPKLPRFMSRSPVHLDDTDIESRGTQQQQQLPWRRRLSANLRAFYSRTLELIRKARGYGSLLVEGTLRELSQRHRLYANLRAFLSRFLALAWKPKRFAPIIIDCWLLVQSIWIGKQLGPDLVYPMLGIRKRQSGRLAKLILKHSRDQRLYELRAASTFPRGIDPPSVAIIDLSKVADSEDIIENRYSTQVDFYGLIWMLILVESILALVLHVFYLWDQGPVAWVNCGFGAAFNLFFCWSAVWHGDGTLTLALRSDASASGCAVFLDQDFTLVLNGNQNVIEAIVEGSFNLAYDSVPSSSPVVGGPYYRNSFYGTLDALCEGACLSALVLCCLLFRPPALGAGALGLASAIIALLPSLLRCRPSTLNFSQASRVLTTSCFRGIPVLCLYVWYQQRPQTSHIYTISWHFGIIVLSNFLFVLFSLGDQAQNHPIRSNKFLDAIGNPRIRKWEFDTLAASATFQCLVICHGIDRPVRDIDVLAFLDMLVPDQRRVWKVWKERVADRIIHEELQDINFTPTIPTFPDERQQQLKDLLDQAQLGYTTYIDFFARRVQPDSLEFEATPAEDSSRSIFSTIWSRIRGFSPSTSFTNCFRSIP